MNFSSDNIRVEHPLTQPITDIQSMVERPYLSNTDLSNADGDLEVEMEISAAAELQTASSKADGAVVQQTLAEGVRSDAIALHERYVLEEVLAVGGSGIVYKALDLCHGGTSRPVALKTLRPELRENAHAIERMKREFRYTAVVAHPHTVRMLDLEKIGGVWCIVMELLAGESLATKLYDMHPECMPATQALSILKACSRALSAAHQRGVVHCDFKPGNVWITLLKDGCIDVRVLDFGAAHRYAMQPKNAAKKSMWLTGEPLLPATVTPAYASPQVLTGEPPDPRDDVFSFACVAYEVFAGRHPFGRLNAVEMMATGRPLLRPIGLSFPRWRALQRGLAWQRDLRPLTVSALMLELDAQPFEIEHPNIRIWLERWTLSTADWFAVTGLLGKSRADALPQYLRLRNIHNRRFGLVSRSGEGRVQAAKIIHRIGQVSSAVGGGIIERARRTLALIGNRGHALLDRATAIHPLQRMLFELKTSAAKLVTFKKTWNMDGNRYFIGVGLALLLIASVVLFMQRWRNVDDNPSIDGFAQSRSYSTDRILAFVSPAAAIANSPAAPFENTPWQRWLDRDVEWLWVNDMLQPTEPSAGIIATDNAMFVFTPRQNAVKQSRRVVATMQPSNSVTLAHARVEVSDQAFAAVLLLKRAGRLQEPVTVRWRTVVGSAKPGTDYEDVLSGTARFADNQTVRTLYVPIKQNRLSQGDRSFVVELSNPSGGAALGQISRAVVTIRRRES